MSTCISSHGEFSKHKTDGEFTCTLCGVFDEAGALERIRQLEQAVAEVERRTWGIAAGQFMQRGLDEAARIAFDTAEALTHAAKGVGEDEAGDE